MKLFSTDRSVISKRNLKTMETDMEHFKTVRYGELTFVSLVCDGMRIASAAIDPGNRDGVISCYKAVSN